MPGAHYLEKNGYKEKSPGLGAGKRFLLKGFQASDDRKSYLLQLTMSVKVRIQYNIIPNVGRKKAI